MEVDNWSVSVVSVVSSDLRCYERRQLARCHDHGYQQRRSMLWSKRRGIQARWHGREKYRGLAQKWGLELAKFEPESLTRHMSSTHRVLYASACAVTVPACYSTVTLNFDLLTPKRRIHLCPIIHHWCNFGENSSNVFQDIVLTSPESAVSSKLYSTVTLTFNPLTPNCEAFISIPQCIVDVSLVKMCQILYSVSQKKSPPWDFLTFFSQTVGNFWSKFYLPIIRSYLR